MPVHKKQARAKALELINTGLSQKEVAVIVGVRKDTVTNWVKFWRGKDAPIHEIINNIIQDLQTLSKNSQQNARDIMELSTALEKLTARLFLKTI